MNGVVKQGFPGKVPFEQRLFLGEQSSKEQEQNVQRPKVGEAFTQIIYNVGESLFSDVWIITGFDFNLSMISQL